jgi:4-hydroxythreonine-4-phosphate dehydrogenase
MKRPVVAITLGDPGGIGPEVTLKALSRLRADPLFKSAYFIWIGIPSLFEAAHRRLRIPLSPVWLPVVDESKLELGRIHLLDIATSPVALETQQLRIIPTRFDLGKVSERNGYLAWTSLRIGAYLASCGIVQALVTAPVHKQAMRLVSPGFVGHTEYLAQVSRVKKVAMMFDAGRFRLTLVTTHLPLRKVPMSLNKRDICDKVRLTADFLRRRFRIRRPRIAVLALNPHGEEFGTEERRIILPAIRAMRSDHLVVTGPHPADGFFLEREETRCDAVIAMYHDQGLIPLKRLAGREAVNLTLGLPYVRTSPDHGTAFEIAGLWKADETSMWRALCLAVQLARGI